MSGWTLPDDPEAPVFPIAIAARLADMHPQTLRQYDRLGLVSPRRTAGKSRRYSMRDVEQLGEVQRLSAEGVSLEGIRRILQLENEVVQLRQRVRRLERQLAEEMRARPGRRVFAAGPGGSVVSLPAGVRVRRRTDLVVWRPDPRGVVADDAVFSDAEEF